jgi:hypothetical protein
MLTPSIRKKLALTSLTGGGRGLSSQSFFRYNNKDVKYLGLHLDRRFTWHKKHFRKTEATRNHPHQNILVTRTRVKTLYKQQTSHILYKRILNPVRTYGIQLLDTSCTWNVDVLELFQWKALRTIVYGYRKGSSNTNS